MRVVEGVLEILRDEGVDRVFGNPGTTELPLVGALAADERLHYVLGPHEGALVAAADGYARATRRPAFVNLHVAAGLANGLIGMLNARRSRTPLVITAGQQDSRHLIQDPMLSGDLVAIASGAAKWAVEVHRADEVGPMLRRAFRAAVTPPQGPVFVSVPMDLLEAELDGPVPARSVVQPATGRVELGPALGLLRSAASPAVVAGDGVGRSGPGAVAALVRVAERLGAHTFHVPMNDRLDFPMDHPLYAGMLLPENERIRAVLDAHDVVLLAGARAFAPHHYTPGPAVSPSVTLIQLDDDPAEIGRNYPVAAGLCGDVGLILDALADGLGAPVDGCPAAATPALAGAGNSAAAGAPRDRLDPGVAAAVVAANLPDGAIVVEEAITVGLRLREQWRLHEPDSFHHTVGGGLGWGIGAAVGVSLGRPDRPVVAALGDGCALFGVHGLWMAANQHRPVTAVVFSNGEYRTLKNTLTHMRGGAGPFVGMDLNAPALDWPALSGALGVPAVRVDDADQLGKLLRERSAADGPLLVEVPIS